MRTRRNATTACSASGNPTREEVGCSKNARGENFSPDETHDSAPTLGLLNSTYELKKTIHLFRYTPTCVYNDASAAALFARFRARQLYKNISMLFLFPVKAVSLVQASIHNVSYISLQSSKITLQNNIHK